MLKVPCELPENDALQELSNGVVNCQDTVSIQLLCCINRPGMALIFIIDLQPCPVSIF